MRGRKLTWWERITGRCIHGADGPPASETIDVAIQRRGVHYLSEVEGMEVISIQFRGGVRRDTGEFDIEHTAWLKSVGCGLMSEDPDSPLTMAYVRQSNHFILNDDDFVYREYHIRINAKRK